MKNLFSVETMNAQVELNENAKNVSNKQNAKNAKKTALNSNLFSKSQLNDTAKLDFVVIAALYLSDYRCTTQQVLALAKIANLNQKRLNSVYQTEKHIKNNELFTVSDNNVLSIDSVDLQRFYRNTFFSTTYRNQIEELANDLFLFVEEQTAENLNTLHFEAITNNVEFNKKAKAAKAAAKKAAKAKK